MCIIIIKKIKDKNAKTEMTSLMNKKEEEEGEKLMNYNYKL